MSSASSKSALDRSASSLSIRSHEIISKFEGNRQAPATLSWQEQRTDRAAVLKILRKYSASFEDVQSARVQLQSFNALPVEVHIHRNFFVSSL
ncbi:unnamed protein product [Calypogeia fissa]